MAECVSLVLNESQCSYNCVFCNGRPMGDIKKNVEFELNKLKRICETKKVTHVEISGNDPCEYEKLPQFIKEIKKISNTKSIQLSTHAGTLRNLDFFEELIEEGLTSLRVPLYGATKEVHEAIIGGTNSFEDIIAFFENAKKLKIDVDVTSLITKENQDHLKALFRVFSKLKFVNSFKLSLPAYTETHRNFLKSVPDFSKLKTTLKGDLRYALAKGLKIDLGDIPYCLIGFDYPYIVPFLISPNAYEFRRDEKDNVSIVKGIVVPNYLKKGKGSGCEKCKFNPKCFGIFAAYVNKGFFKFEPIE